jgi:hypothetical protein
LIFYGLSSNYDNCFEYGLDKKVAQCLSPIIYGVESGPLLFFLCQITLPSTFISNGFHPKKRKMNSHQEMVVLLAAMENGCLAFLLRQMYSMIP